MLNAINNSINIGEMAPDFTLQDNHNQFAHLKDYLGKKVLLSWHPIAWTGVCTDQMRSLEVNFDEFKALNVVAFGLSVDPSASKKAWANVLCINNIRLLSDFWPHGLIAQDYGVFMEEFGVTQRVNIIIDETGIVRWVKVYPLHQLPDINEVFQVIRDMDK